MIDNKTLEIKKDLKERVREGDTKSGYVIVLLSLGIR